MRFRILLLVLTFHASSGSAASNIPLLALGMDTFIASSLRSGFGLELFYYPLPSKPLALGFGTEVTLMHRETFYQTIFMYNHIRKTEVSWLNGAFTFGTRYFDRKLASKDFGLSYAIPAPIALTPRFAIIKRVAEPGSREVFLSQEDKRKTFYDLVLSLEFITGTYDR